MRHNSLDDDIQFAQAWPMTVVVPINDAGKADSCIDGMTPVCVCG
jgi:hypothetical protein